MQRLNRQAVVWLSALVLTGCPKDEPKKTEPSAKPAVSSAAPVASAAPAPASASPSASASVAAPEKSALVLAPVVPALAKESSMDHADVFGWSADGASFAYCKHSGGLGGATCVVFPREGKPETFGDFDEAKSEIDKALHAKLEERKKALALATPPQRWAYPDLELTWDVPAGNTLRVGARVKGEAPAFAIVLRDTHPGAEEGSTHPELIALSADGAFLGVIAHSFHGEYTDNFATQVMAVGRVASIAYNNAGLDHHKKKEFKESAALFEKASAADPGHALAAYNLACAYARLGDPRAEKALGDALGRAGATAAQMKKRAVSDDDFSSVKTAAWFVAATKG